MTTTSIPPLVLNTVGQNVNVTCQGVLSTSVGGSTIVSLSSDDGINVFKSLLPATGTSVSLGDASAPFERIHVKAIKGDVIFDGNATFNGNTTFAKLAGAPSNTTTTNNVLASTNSSTNPLYTPVQTLNESTAGNASTQWCMTNEPGTMGLRLVQNGRASTHVGGNNAAFIHNACGDLYIGNTYNTRAMSLFSTGPLANVVCIGVTQENAPSLITLERANLSSYKLMVNGVAWSTSWRTVSDRNAKENIQPITSALEKVHAIKGYTYNLKDEPESLRMAGVMAQDVETVLPEAVDRFANGAYALDYNGVVSLLVEAIKELDARTRQDHKFSEVN